MLLVNIYLKVGIFVACGVLYIYMYIYMYIYICIDIYVVSEGSLIFFCNFLRNSSLSVLYIYIYSRSLNKSVCISCWLGICWWFELLVLDLFQCNYPFSITSTITDLTAPSIPPVGLKHWYSAHNSATMSNTHIYIYMCIVNYIYPIIILK